MFESALARRIRIMIAAAALCVVVSGCAADLGAATSQKSDGGGQLRYYGGPKSPMWSSQ
jgi:hypothetical protein